MPLQEDARALDILRGVDAGALNRPVGVPAEHRQHRRDAEQRDEVDGYPEYKDGFDYNGLG
jgi:hypothetical protein